MERRYGLRGKGLLVLVVFWFLWFTNMLVRVCFAPLLPLIEDEFGVTHAAVGSIFLFLSIGYGLSMMFSGLYSGRFGYKRSIALGLAVASLLLFLIPFVKWFSFLYVFAFFLGASVGVYVPAALPLITEYFTENKWGKAIAIHDTGAPIAIFFCPLLALFLLLFFGWRGMIQTLGVLLLADAAACCFVGHEVRIARFERARFGDVLRMRPLWMLLTLFTLGTGVNFGIYNIASLYMTKELLFDIGYANRILSLSRLGAIGVAVAVVFLVDRIEQKKAMFVIMLATGVVTICMGFAPAGYAGILLFLQAIVVAGLFPLSLVVAAKLFPREMRSLATAIIVASAMFIGGGVTPYLLGLSGDLASFRLGFAILGLLICLSSPLALALKAHK